MDNYRGNYYFGSKAAMNMFSRSKAWDTDVAGIITIALHLGWARTDMGVVEADLPVGEIGEGLSSGEFRAICSKFDFKQNFSNIKTGRMTLAQ
jgi:NAD(P)-dependent dehydrogenase (short-subunit alcohol dehydrogenase family)